MLEGQFEFQVSGERYVLGPREMIIIPQGAPHGFVCRSSTSGRMLTISSPARVFEAFVAESARRTRPAWTQTRRQCSRVTASSCFSVLVRSPTPQRKNASPATGNTHQTGTLPIRCRCLQRRGSRERIHPAARPRKARSHRGTQSGMWTAPRPERDTPLRTPSH